MNKKLSIVTLISILIIFSLAVFFLIFSYNRVVASRVAVNLIHKTVAKTDQPIYLGKIELKQNEVTKYPVGAAIYKDEIYVSFYNSNAIDIFSLDGNLKRQIPIKIGENKTFPLGLAFIDGQMAITDVVNGFFGFYDTGGKIIDGFYSLEDKSNLKPVGVSAFKKLYYFTDANLPGWVAVHKTGKLINAVSYKEGKSKLESPQGIIVTDDGRAIVSDNLLGKVKVYNCSGWYAYDFEDGNTKEKLKAPMGIALDGLKRVHVVDNKQNKVFMFDDKGKFLFSYGKDLVGPTGIVIDASKRVIYILNTEAQSISVWGY